MRKHPLYTFEYFMNRPYAYYRDKYKCRICNGFVLPHEARFHHIEQKLPKELVNKVNNLMTVHEHCHNLIHNNDSLDNLSPQTIKKIEKYRKKLGISEDRSRKPITEVG